MSEAWRYKTYYKPRVLIETSRVLFPQFADSVLCITGAELELLRNLMQYLHRRSTFASEYQDVGYLAPSNEEWDSITAIVATLEEKLMGCEQFLSLLEDILTQVTCICQKTTVAADVLGNLPFYGPSLQPVLEGHITTGAMQIEDDYGSDTPGSADRCAVAQLAWSLAFEMTDEILYPAASEAVDILLPLAMVALAVMCGTSVLGIPIGILLAALWSLIKVDVAGSMEDVQNSMISNKEELVCAVWRGLMFNYQTAQMDAAEVISEMAGLSFLDKACLRLLYTPFMMALAAKAWANQTAWAMGNVDVGYCADCDEIIGTDWWARALEPSANTITLVNVGNAHWEKDCWEGTVPAGQTCCGIVYRVEQVTGDCSLKAMSSAEAECIGLGLWPDTSWPIPADIYFAVNGTNIDNVECKATLCPDAFAWPTGNVINRRTGPCDIAGGFHFGWNCEGSVTIVVLYQVFEGTSPP